MKKGFIKALCLNLAIVCIAPVMKGCGKKEIDVADRVQTIVIGHHYLPEDDPYYVDEITGESGMSEDNRRAAIKALDIVKEKLGVDIKWISYPSNISQCVLQSVLANDPICHIPIMSNGNQARLLAQNVLQPLDNYKDIFDSNPDYNWLMLDKCFGHYYLLNREYLFMNNWPIVYNATMIEKIPALKNNGKTVYPATLYEEGKWTWSVFEDYLETVQAYYSGKKANTGADIYPFHTNYTYTILFALHSNGACLYDGKKMTFASENGKAAAEYLTRLIKRGLVNCLRAGPNTTDTGYMAPTDAFMRGETVFNNAARWRMDNCGTALAERGESMAVIPFPRPDEIVIDDPYEDYGKGNYQIYSSVADSVGLLRGFDEEESRLALEAYAMYRTEFYKALGAVDSFQEYKETMAAGKAVEDGVDIFHPEIGEANLRIYKQLASIPENEFGESMDLMWSYCSQIFGKSAYGVQGAPAYSIHVEAQKASVQRNIDRITELLKSKGATDTTAPSSYRTSSEPLVFPKGTKADKIDWTKYFAASDNVDGEYDMMNENGNILIRGKTTVQLEEESAIKEKREAKEVAFEKNKFTVTCPDVDFDAVGEYTEGVTVTVTDSSGNIDETKYTLYIYDKKNAVAPTLTLKDEEKAVDYEADTSEVKWSDFVSEAKDVNGIDLKSYVSADVSYLDVTVPGEYPVEIYVVDFAGNKTAVKTTVRVKSK